jgi:hypothetical protein
LIAAARDGRMMNWKGLSFRTSIMWSNRRLSENQQMEACHYPYITILLSLLFMTAASSAI